MSTIQTFDFQTQAVRVIEKDSLSWFVASDVCRILEIANPRAAITSLEEDEKGVVNTDTLGGAQKTNIISESGLYALIFRSRKPAAKAFRKWVTATVLPAIRKFGAYIHPAPEIDINALVTNTLLDVASGKCGVDKGRVISRLAHVLIAQQNGSTRRAAGRSEADDVSALQQWMSEQEKVEFLAGELVAACRDLGICLKCLRSPSPCVSLGRLLGFHKDIFFRRRDQRLGNLYSLVTATDRPAKRRGRQLAASR